MRPHELLAFALLCAAGAALADPPDYGKADTFQPGKKYNCVPTADRKGWDCKETGKADIPAAPPPAMPPERPPAATPAPVAHAAAPAQAATPHSSALPSYLTNSGANQPMQPMPAAAAPKPAPKPRVKGPMVPARTVVQTRPAPKSEQAPTEPTRVEPTPESALLPAAPAPAPAAQDFLALPADAYVIELAHAATATDLAAPNPACGKVYKLHLHQNGADVWLLVCGPYENLQAARAARGELAAQGATAGWPRRVGPLQTEVRRLQP